MHGRALGAARDDRRVRRSQRRVAVALLRWDLRDAFQGPPPFLQRCVPSPPAGFPWWCQPLPCRICAIDGVRTICMSVGAVPSSRTCCVAQLMAANDAGLADKRRSELGAGPGISTVVCTAVRGGGCVGRSAVGARRLRVRQPHMHSRQGTQTRFRLAEWSAAGVRGFRGCSSGSTAMSRPPSKWLISRRRTAGTGRMSGVLETE